MTDIDANCNFIFRLYVHGGRDTNKTSFCPSIRNSFAKISSLLSVELNIMHLYFLLLAVFSTAIGCPTGEAQLPTENSLSFVPPDLEPSSNELPFVPPDLAPSSNELNYEIATGSQDSDGQIFQDFTIADQAAPKTAKLDDIESVIDESEKYRKDANGQRFQDFTVADQAAPTISKAVLDNIESVTDESEKYRTLSCADGWGVCCQGNNPSSANDYLPCSGSKYVRMLHSQSRAKLLCLESKNVYAGYEEIANQDPRYGRYCYNPVYIHTSQCGNIIFIDLQVRKISLKTIRQLAR